MHSQADMLTDADRLVKVLQKKSPKKLMDLMDISEALAEQNYQRFQEYTFEHPGSPDEHSRQALWAYTGDVYSGFSLEDYQEEDYSFAQDHLRILSGLYGLLRPMDVIQPYRLEMKTALKNTRGDNLYKFWGDRLVKAMNEALEASGSNVLINLASNEYTKALPKKKLKAEIITPTFKDWKNGTYKSLMLFLKQARGRMADYMVRERITDPEGLKAFEGMGYTFNPDLSEGNDWVFTRELA